MASTQNSALKIRLLNGPCAHQEVILPEGTVTLGNTRDSDFIISDPDKSEQKIPEGEQKEPAKPKGKQEEKGEEKEGEKKELSESGKLKFELLVDGNTVTLQTKPEEPLKILINGEPAKPTDDKLFLPKNVIISINEIDFVLGGEKSNLSKVKLKQTKTENLIFQLKNTLRTNKKMVIYAGTGFVLTIVVLFLIVKPVFFRSNQAPQKISKKEAIKRQHAMVATLLTKKNMRDIKIQWREDNSLLLSGYVHSPKIKNKFLDKLNNAKINYEDNILDMESIANLAKMLIQGKGYKEANVVPDGRNGFVIIKGKIIGNTQWDAVSKQLVKDVNGLKGWRIVTTKTNFTEELLVLLASRDLSRHLAVVDRGNTTFITGQLNQEDTDVLNQLIEEVKEKNRSEQQVIYQNIPYSDSLYPEFIPSPLVSFGGDNNSAYFILEDGTRCDNGTILPSGYVVTSIGKDGITLEKNGDIAHFPVFT